MPGTWVWQCCMEHKHQQLWSCSPCAWLAMDMLWLPFGLQATALEVCWFRIPTSNANQAPHARCQYPSQRTQPISFSSGFPLAHQSRSTCFPSHPGRPTNLSWYRCGSEFARLLFWGPTNRCSWWYEQSRWTLLVCKRFESEKKLSLIGWVWSCRVEGSWSFQQYGMIRKLWRFLIWLNLWGFSRFKECEKNILIVGTSLVCNRARSMACYNWEASQTWQNYEHSRI